jgi:hypothetical protein
MSVPPSAGRRTAWIFLLFQALYGLTSSGNVFRAPDEFEVYFQAEHLIDAGDLSVPQTLAIRQPKVVDGQAAGSEPMFFGKIGRDGKPYAPYGPAAAILALPHHLFGRAVAAIAGVPRAPLPGGIPWLVVVGGLTMLATATAGALTVAGFHRGALALGAAPSDALRLSLLLGGATVLWPFSTNFFSEAYQAAALIWAAVFLLERRLTIVAAALLGLAALTKVTSLIFLPAFAIAVLADRTAAPDNRAKAAVAIVAAAAIAVAIHLTWNVYRFGDAFDFGYDWSETIPQLPARAFLIPDIPRGLAVLLLSPGKSLLLWAPPLILAFASLRAFWNAHRAPALGVLVAFVSGLLFYAAYLFPEGGYAHGPRNLVPIVPLLLLPASSRRWSARSLALVGAVGFVVALSATAVSYLDDQNIGSDLGSGARTVYYERISPPPGRVWNRYRLDYLPFVATLGAPGWVDAPVLGQGPDYFPLHLLQARRQLPNGGTIPIWLIGLLPIGWLTLLIGSAVGVYRY